jgi:hypothetical protein
MDIRINLLCIITIASRILKKWKYCQKKYFAILNKFRHQYKSREIKIVYGFTQPPDNQKIFSEKPWLQGFLSIAVT